MNKYFRIPIVSNGIPSLPCPTSLEEIAKNVVLLLKRSSESQQARNALSVPYTVRGKTAPAYFFLYGNDSEKTQASLRKDALNELRKTFKVATGVNVVPWIANKFQDLFKATEPEAKAHQGAMFLEEPKQFAMSWTTMSNFHREATETYLDTWAKSLTDVEEANTQFWNTMARYGIAYNLLILQKVSDKNIEAVRTAFAQTWDTDLENLYQEKKLFCIDLRFFSVCKVQKEVKGYPRYTPATMTLLQQDSNTKEIKPIAVSVVKPESNDEYTNYRYKQCTDSAWLCALQAAKASATVYGIWIGHVYHWHIVTASMQMCMYNNLSSNHKLYQFLEPQSNYLIPFDLLLLLTWKQAAPPTSINSGFEFADLLRTYAKDRKFFDDDPLVELANMGIVEEDFTVNTPWDMFPIVADMLKIWNLTQTYTEKVIDNLYADDTQVATDKELQNWIKEAGKTDSWLHILDILEVGNIQGLPKMDSKANLKRVITSILYRINMHGAARMPEVANPFMAYVPNFPPCLQSAELPSPDATISTEQLLSYLPNTEVIGEMVNFYYEFAFTAPYESALPLFGNDSTLFWKDLPITDPKNKALVDFRNGLEEFIRAYIARATGVYNHEPQIHQWDLNIET
ncbi:MAG: hypothetical protein EAZ95_04755 [Bacteroidetes bacterium]|nr:MAG: hypothetical protein EAZ95_04755 [Bacteroidota bacterium]